MWKKKLNRYKGLTFEPSFSLTAQFKMSSQDQDNPVQKKRHDCEELQLNGRNLIIHLISDIMIEVIMTEVVSLIHIDIHLTMIGVTHPLFLIDIFLITSRSPRHPSYYDRSLPYEYSHKRREEDRLGKNPNVLQIISVAMFKCLFNIYFCMLELDKVQYGTIIAKESRSKEMAVLSSK
jgi:hypothetical protein